MHMLPTSPRPSGNAWLRRLAAAALLWLAAASASQAHLMVAQRGTLNIVGDGAFMVLSLPVSAFSSVDDDGDGKLSTAEFSTHRAAIAAAIRREVKLLDEDGPRPLEGVLLSLAPPDNAPAQPASQLVVMGRFTLAGANHALRFEAGLFGKEAAEQTFQISVSRASKTQKQLLILTPQQPARALFPSSWSVFADYVVLGAQHILTGFDHLLFLLVVLAAGWGWRQVLVALTAFTVGHAITLTLSVIGGLAVPAAVVEPTIAATIAGMAAFDFYVRRRKWTPSPWWRLSLVFGCALVHGLGLASVLTELGLDSPHQLPSLAGFNVGIELGQLAVALIAASVALGVRRLHGDAGLVLATRLASVLAMGIGSVWFVQRVVGFA
jgi:HupE / UreJ protein